MPREQVTVFRVKDLIQQEFFFSFFFFSFYFSLQKNEEVKEVFLSL